MTTATGLDLDIGLGNFESIDDIVDLVRRAERLGFDLVSVGETSDWNVVPLLSAVATQTETVGVATTVLSPYSRAPTLMGQTALAMHEVSDGRFRLGLGPSSPAIAERWHGQSFDRPLRRLRETIEIVREVYDGGAVDYDGDVFDIGGLSYERSPPANPPPIDVATLGPKATELAGRFADGWAPQMFTRGGLRTRLADFERGVDLSEYGNHDRRVSPIVRCFAHEDPGYARSLARRMISFLIGAYGPFYGESVANQGYEDVVAEIRSLWDDDRNTDAMAAALPDEVLDALAAVGTPANVRETVESFCAIDGVSTVRVAFVNGMSADEMETTLDALAPLTDAESN